MSYAPAHDRAALTALFAIDAAMADVVRTTSEPMLGPIRLAWWRERLEDLDSGGAAPPEPRLQAVERELKPRRVSGRDLADLEGGWHRLFDPFPWGMETGEAIWLRGNRLFGLAGQIVGVGDQHLQDAGGLWALVDAARHCSDSASRGLLIEQALHFAARLGDVRFRRAHRPLSMLAALAIRDVKRGEPFEAEASPGRAAALLRHRLSGRLPHL